MFTPMTQTKTVSTRIDNNVHTLFTDYCNQQGMTMSQMLNQFVNDVVEANKDLVDSSQCSIDSDEETESKELTKFSQDEQPRDILKEAIRILDEKKAKELSKQALESIISDMFSGIKMEIEALKKTIEQKNKEDQMKKQMACFDNDSCFTK
jgi:antitoxin component of RelBE/YafQ-DinJ toxin-antitoxin module